MLLIDDIILFPIRGLVFLFREVRNATQQEVANDAEAIRTELRELYMMLETGALTEAEFDARESELLDRLDEIEGTPAEAPVDSARGEK